MRKRRTIIYGVDNISLYEKIVSQGYEVIGILDPTEKSKGEKVQGVTVFGFECLIALRYECVLLVNDFYAIGKVLHQFGVPWDKILVFFQESGNEWEDVRFVMAEDRVKAQFDNISFYMKNRTDFHIMNEIFLKDEYSFFLDGTPCTVFDIGMNVGIATLYFSKYENVKRIYSFEPFPQTYEQALANFELNPEEIRSKITAFNFGLSDHDGEEMFDYFPDYPGNARTVHGAPELGVVTERMREMVGLKDAAEVLGPLFEKSRDMRLVMKIDCEGAEYAIFDSLERKGLLSCVSAFLMETHWGKEKLLKDSLRSLGYAYFSPYMGGEGKTGMLYAVKARDK